MTKKCKNEQQKLRYNKIPIPEKLLVKKVEFNGICSVCENERPFDWYQKKSFVCKICIAERQYFYSRKLPIPDRLKSKNVHKILNKLFFVGVGSRKKQR